MTRFDHPARIIRIDMKSVKESADVLHWCKILRERGSCIEYLRFEGERVTRSGIGSLVFAMARHCMRAEGWKESSVHSALLYGLTVFEMSIRASKGFTCQVH